MAMILLFGLYWLLLAIIAVCAIGNVLYGIIDLTGKATQHFFR